MTFWGKIFGGGVERVPYDSEIEYVNGTKGRIPVWATDGRDALIQISKLIPTHEQISEILIYLRRDWAGFHPVTEGKEKRSGSNPSPATSKPDFNPPGQGSTNAA